MKLRHVFMTSPFILFKKMSWFHCFIRNLIPEINKETIDAFLFVLMACRITIKQWTCPILLGKPISQSLTAFKPTIKVQTLPTWFLGPQKKPELLFSSPSSLFCFSPTIYLYHNYSLFVLSFFMKRLSNLIRLYNKDNLSASLIFFSNHNIITIFFKWIVSLKR